jgi:PTH1 family peptidyl-tRNA hydrolase
MYIIVGLGNPGRKYENTRHNAGFEVIDVLAEKFDIPVTEKKHKALIGKGQIEGQSVILVKPQTFMNLSGESVSDVLHFYKLDAEEDLIVISDDVSLEVGRLRVRSKGSAGGHNGLKNIIAHCGTEAFSRVRVGVGKPTGDMISYVLGHFPTEEQELLEKTYEKAAQAVVCIMTADVEQAMNLYNGKVEL